MSPIPQPLQSLDLDAQPLARDGDGPELLAQFQVCQRLGISDETWRRWRKALRTPEAVTMPSGRLKWRASDIAAMAGRPVERPGRRFFASARRLVAHPSTVGRTLTSVKRNSFARNGVVK